jgi:hypothetical protein
VTLPLRFPDLAAAYRYINSDEKTQKAYAVGLIEIRSHPEDIFIWVEEVTE